MIRWLATFILVWFLYQIRHVFPPMIVGGIIAYIVLPLVNQITQSTKLPRSVSTLVVFAGLFSCLIALGYFLGPAIVKELKDLAEPQSQREIIAGAIKQFADSFHWTGNVDETTDQILKTVGEAIQKPEEIMHLGGLLSHGALSVLVCTVTSIYLTLDAPAVGQFFLRFAPESRRAEIVELFSKMNIMLSKYVRGQILLIVIMSGVAYLILSCYHVKYALPIAIFSGFLEVIPVLGPIIATTTATLVAVSQLGAAGLWIIPWYTIARWIEDYVIVPKVIGHAVELHPLAVIFAVLCGETLAGGLGMLIAIPVAACVKLVLDYYSGQLQLEDTHAPASKKEKPSNKAAASDESGTKPEKTE